MMRPITPAQPFSVQMTTSNSGNKPRRSFKNDRFLETLRELGGGIGRSAVRDVVKGLPGEALNQIARPQSGELKPNQSLDLKQLSQKQTLEEKESQEGQTRQFQQEFLNIRHQERMLWKRSEQETRLQIETIVQELGQIVTSTKELTKEVAVAAQQVPVEPGAYHLSFFQRLRQRLIAYQKGLQESATWLQMLNSKAKKRNYYWGQVRKSGTKFMLSQERYMATQAG